ncbi:hypothetical protein INT47_011392 [Mucor saturninus]|uniref:Uncharacterized protein n=1 Tax=Mucor saturninus TaxID=64648 RepID=A0A8H7QR31_9FUNG|nr:hypothetical protein INT47_011392 [Mucor saturninus]
MCTINSSEFELSFVQPSRAHKNSSEFDLQDNTFERASTGTRSKLAREFRSSFRTLDPIYNNALETLRSVLTSHPVDYQFRGNSIYYDPKARLLVEHRRAFDELVISFIYIELPVFNCFPLRRSWARCYTTIDSKILCQNILGRRWTNRQDKIAIWRERLLKKLLEDVLRWILDEEICYSVCMKTQPQTIQTSFALPNQDNFEKIKKYRRIREAVKLARVAAAERLLINYDSLNRDEFEQYIANRSNRTDIIQYYVNFLTNHRTAHPLHRKLRLSAYIRRQQGNEDLISKLDIQFGVEAIYVMAGKRVCLIDEFRTSQCCPTCEIRSLETFRMVDNPRPHRRREDPRVIRHGLLRIVPRLWNCDMTACLNMVDIVRSFRAGNGIPPQGFDVERFPRTNGEKQEPKMNKQTLEMFVNVVTRIFQACYRRSTIDTLKW